MWIYNDESEVCAHKQQSFNSLKSLAAFKEDGATCLFVLDKVRQLQFIRTT